MSDSYLSYTLEQLLTSFQKLDWVQFIDHMTDLKNLIESYYDEKIKQVEKQYEEELSVHKLKLTKRQEEYNELNLQNLREENARLYKENIRYKERLDYFEQLIKKSDH